MRTRSATAVLSADKLPHDTGPDRAALPMRLAFLEQQIARGREQFARQLEIVAGIERRQGDAATAREMLRLFAQAHVLRLDDRDRLKHLLEGAGRPGPSTDSKAPDGRGRGQARHSAA